MTRNISAKVRRVIALASVVLAVVQLAAQSAPSAWLLVLSKTDLALVMVDPVTLKPVARIPSGPDPHEVVASADGRFAYISNYGFGTSATLSVADLIARNAVAPINLGALRSPHGLMWAGGKAWFTAEAAKAIGSYDPATSAIDFVLGTGQNRTHMIYVTEDLRRIITTNVSSATVSIIDKVTLPPFGRGPGPTSGGRAGPPPTAGRQGGPPPSPRTDWDQTVVTVGRGAEGFDVTPDGKEVWTGDAQDGTISVVDLSTKKNVATIAANVPGINRLKFTPDGRLALVSTLAGPDVVVYDVHARKEVKRVKVGHGAAGIQIQPDGKRAYVACSPDDYVAVLDLQTLDVVGRVDAGGQPDGLAWAVRR
jgi:YVTN family beta-propeller protein